MRKIETTVAKLCSVTHDKATDEVFVTFKVISEEYKELVFRLGRHDDVDVVIRGANLAIVQEEDDNANV